MFCILNDFAEMAHQRDGMIMHLCIVEKMGSCDRRVPKS